VPKGRAASSTPPTPQNKKVMAQLPPRAPSAAPQDHWPAAAGEFLGFAAARRGAHRRSASDSAAFLEAVPIDDDVVIGGGGGGGDDFDRLDHDQLLSMFSDVDVSVSVSVSGSAGERAQLMDAGGADDGVADSSPAAADGVAEPKRVKRLVATCSLPSGVVSGGSASTF
jgi:hypothetical protein